MANLEEAGSADGADGTNFRYYYSQWTSYPQAESPPARIPVRRAWFTGIHNFHCTVCPSCPGSTFNLPVPGAVLQIYVHSCAIHAHQLHHARRHDSLGAHAVTTEGRFVVIWMTSVDHIKEAFDEADTV